MYFLIIREYSLILYLSFRASQVYNIRGLEL